jgi:mannose-6-phosphate isomerase-like protein (cupin superfamily)
MSQEPVVVREKDREWETWQDEDVAKRGLVYWRTLVSGGVTQSETLTLGIAKIPPGEALNEHRHQQAEIYLVLEGSGLVRIDSASRPVEAGTAVFIPGNALHSCENTGASELRIAYVLAADSFDDVDYVFED